MSAKNDTAEPSYMPDRGDIVWLVLDPRVGHEQSGRRPAIVLSPKLFTERTGLSVVCPITGKIKGLPFEVVLSDTKTAGAVLPIHVRSVDAEARRMKYIERASNEVVETVNDYVQTIIAGS